MEIEEKGKNWIITHIVELAFLCVFILGMGIRLSLRHFLSDDAAIFLLPWYQQIKENGGIRGIGIQVGNYNFVYQFIIAIFTYLPLDSLLDYKILSCFFDLAISLLLVLCVKEFSNEKWDLILAFAISFLSPIVVLNSACWAQCDSIYSFFCLVTLYLLYKNHFWTGMIMYGVAFSFKLQAIFILPFIFLLYIQNKRFSIKYILGSIAAVLVLFIPGRLAGRKFVDIVKIYMGQAEEGSPGIFHNYPGISNLLLIDGNNEVWVTTVKNFCLISTISVLGCIVVWTIYKKIQLAKIDFVYLAFLLTYTCVLFLPEMHDRYGYIYEIMAILLVVYDKKTIAGLLPLYICTIITYSRFLFKTEYDARLVSIVNVIVYIGYFVYYIKYERKKCNQ